MKAFLHAKVNSKKYGGVPEDYLKIHQFIDSTKAHLPDMRHRALLHSSWGVELCELIFGVHFTNKDGMVVQTKDIAEDHVLEDLGFIPTVQDYLKNMTIEKWMGGKVKKRKRTFHIDKL